MNNELETLKVKLDYLKRLRKNIIKKDGKKLPPRKK
jgi:hypothetical protein